MKFPTFNYRFKLLTAIALFLFSIANNAQAANLIPCGTAGNPCQFCHIFVLIDNILRYILTVVVPLVALAFIVWGGFKMVTSGDNRTRFEDAKKVITATVIGIVIILTSWLVLNTFLDAIGVAEWTGLGNWWQINCP